LSKLSTTHVVLGLLIERPGYGYDLAQRIETRFGFLGLVDGGVYKTLERLQGKGWIEPYGPKPVGGTARGAPRIRYRVTPDGTAEFRRWKALPTTRAYLRDMLRVRLTLATPEDLPELLEMVEEQIEECLNELARLQRGTLVQAADDGTAWETSALIIAEDLEVRLLQTLVDWLYGVAGILERRIEQGPET
jgi:DNA-binding PadR family transcriptional regulator